MQADHQRQACQEMECRMKNAQDKVRQLKENEAILMNKLGRMQTELSEFQKAFLKSQNVPLSTPLLPAASGDTKRCKSLKIRYCPGLGGEEGRIHLVKELLRQINETHDRFEALKCKSKEETARRAAAESVLKKVKREKREWRIKCQYLESVAHEVDNV